MEARKGPAISPAPFPSRGTGRERPGQPCSTQIRWNVSQFSPVSPASYLAVTTARAATKATTATIAISIPERSDG